MKIFIIIPVLLIAFAHLSAQDTYSVSDDIQLDVLSDMLDWDEKLVEFNPTPSVDSTQTSLCVYTHKDEKLIVKLVETDYIGFTGEDANMISVTPGSYNDLTGEVTYEYLESKGYYMILMSYRTTKSYKKTEEVFKKISSLLVLRQTEVKEKNRHLIIEN